MKTIKQHLANILNEVHLMSLNGYVDQPDEFNAMSEIEIAVYEARKVFERNGKIPREGEDETT